MKIAYKLSKNYNILWKLINDGYRIIGYIPYRKKKNNKYIYDVVEIKLRDFGSWNIGTRGIGYDNYEKTKPDFIQNCKEIELRFIKPF